MPSRHRAAALVAAAAVAATAAPVPAAQGAASGGPPGAVVDIDERLLCTFDTELLGEVSGIALSRQHPDVVWATNDSGGGPWLYAVDIATCAVRATLRLLDTPARDHEALAVGRDDEGRDVIWVGDIGDNLGTWPYARIHKVLEPAQLRDADVPVTTYRFTYPEGPVNAEAMLADPQSERLWIITKEAGVAAVVALPRPLSDSTTPMRTESVGSARALITDAAMAPDGERYVLRDYLSAEVFSGWPPGAAQARFRLPIQPQGEAVTWSADGRSLIVASEESGDLIEVQVPRSALGADEGLAGALPRVAGFDIYPYVRIAALALAGIVGLVLLRRVTRRRR